MSVSPIKLGAPWENRLGSETDIGKTRVPIGRILCLFWDCLHDSVFGSKGDDDDDDELSSSERVTEWVDSDDDDVERGVTETLMCRYSFLKQQLMEKEKEINVKTKNNAALQVKAQTLSRMLDEIRATLYKEIVHFRRNLTTNGEETNDEVDSDIFSLFEGHLSVMEEQMGFLPTSDNDLLSTWMYSSDKKPSPSKVGPGQIVGIADLLREYRDQRQSVEEERRLMKYCECDAQTVMTSLEQESTGVQCDPIVDEEEEEEEIHVPLINRSIQFGASYGIDATLVVMPVDNFHRHVASEVSRHRAAVCKEVGTMCIQKKIVYKPPVEEKSPVTTGESECQTSPRIMEEIIREHVLIKARERIDHERAEAIELFKREAEDRSSKDWDEFSHQIEADRKKCALLESKFEQLRAKTEADKQSAVDSCTSYWRNRMDSVERKLVSKQNEVVDLLHREDLLRQELRDKRREISALRELRERDRQEYDAELGKYEKKKNEESDDWRRKVTLDYEEQLKAEGERMDAEKRRAIKTLRGKLLSSRSQVADAKASVNPVTEGYKELVDRVQYLSKRMQFYRDEKEMSAIPAAKPGPSGKGIALVFTDVESSTALWDQLTDTMADSLRIHNQILRDAVVVHDGYEVKSEGDGFFLSFQDTMNAVRFVLEFQENLMKAEWEDKLLQTPQAGIVRGKSSGIVLFKGLRVRMGVHVGDPICSVDEVTGRMDYFGPTINRAARVAGAAAGGQVVVSGPCWDIIKNKMESLGRPMIKNLGTHHFKGLTTPELVMQIMPRSLKGRSFPPLSAGKIVSLPKQNLENLASEYSDIKERLEGMRSGLEKVSDVLSTSDDQDVKKAGKSMAVHETFMDESEDALTRAAEDSAALSEDEIELRRDPSSKWLLTVTTERSTSTTDLMEDFYDEPTTPTGDDVRITVGTPEKGSSSPASGTPHRARMHWRTLSKAITSDSPEKKKAAKKLSYETMKNGMDAMRIRNKENVFAEKILLITRWFERLSLAYESALGEVRSLVERGGNSARGGSPRKKPLYGDDVRVFHQESRNTLANPMNLVDGVVQREVNRCKNALKILLSESSRGNAPAEQAIELERRSSVSGLSKFLDAMKERRESKDSEGEPAVEMVNVVLEGEEPESHWKALKGTLRRASVLDRSKSRATVSQFVMNVHAAKAPGLIVENVERGSKKRFPSSRGSQTTSPTREDSRKSGPRSRSMGKLTGVGKKKVAFQERTDSSESAGTLMPPREEYVEENLLFDEHQSDVTTDSATENTGIQQHEKLMDSIDRENSGKMEEKSQRIGSSRSIVDVGSIPVAQEEPVDGDKDVRTESEDNVEYKDEDGMFAAGSLVNFRGNMRRLNSGSSGSGSHDAAASDMVDGSVVARDQAEEEFDSNRHYSVDSSMSENRRKESKDASYVESEAESESSLSQQEESNADVEHPTGRHVRIQVHDVGGKWKYKQSSDSEASQVEEIDPQTEAMKEYERLKGKIQSELDEFERSRSLLEDRKRTFLKPWHSSSQGVKPLESRLRDRLPDIAGYDPQFEAVSRSLEQEMEQSNWRESAKKETLVKTLRSPSGPLEPIKREPVSRAAFPEVSMVSISNKIARSPFSQPVLSTGKKRARVVASPPPKTRGSRSRSPAK